MDLFDQLIQAARNDKRAVYGLNEEYLRQLDDWIKNPSPKSAKIATATSDANVVKKATPQPQKSGKARQSASPRPTPIRFTPVDATMIATADMDKLKQLTASCLGCRLGCTRTNVVFGEGNPHAELMFIGEGPGADEDAQGRPFVGAAGQLLNKMIAAMQFSREEVYIANVVKCRPSENRNPLPDEAAACLPFLRRQIDLVKPKVIVALGAVAVRYLFNTDEGINRLRGNWLDFNGIAVMPTYHPAFLLRSPNKKREEWSDLKQVMAKFGKFPPTPTA